jgi:hypothetical protein
LKIDDTGIDETKKYNEILKVLKGVYEDGSSEVVSGRALSAL